MATSIPARVVEEDASLTDKESQARKEAGLIIASPAAALLELRWHWTLDKSNAGRVTQSEYARAVGRTQPLISRDARAYIVYQEGYNTGVIVTPQQARDKVTGEEKRKQKQKEEEERRKNNTTAFLLNEGEIGVAQTHLLNAAKGMEGVTFSDKEREALAYIIDETRRVLDQLDKMLGNASWEDGSRTLKVLA